MMAETDVYLSSCLTECVLSSLYEGYNNAACSATDFVVNMVMTPGNLFETGNAEEASDPN